MQSHVGGGTSSGAFIRGLPYKDIQIEQATVAAAYDYGRLYGFANRTAAGARAKREKENEISQNNNRTQIAPCPARIQKSQRDRTEPCHSSH